MPPEPESTGKAQQSADPQVNTSSRSITLIGLIMFACLFVAGGAWLHFANLAGAIVTAGSVGVAGKPKVIQHLDGGIVRSILVKDGEHVKAHQTLAKLDDTLLRANLQILERRLLEDSARRARLVAERDELDSIVWQDDLLDLFDVQPNQNIKDSQVRLFESRRQSKQGQIDRLRQKSEQYDNQRIGVEAQRASNLAQVKLLDEELNGLRSLEEKGLVRTSQVKSLERQREAINGRYGELGATLSQVQNSINEVSIQILQTNRDFRTQVLTEMREVDQAINEITQRLYTTKEQMKRVEIVSPVEGIIHELQLTTLGGVVPPGATIAQIIPQNENFEIQAQLDPRHIDSVHEGQKARLVFTAFNQSTTPNLYAHVKQISANVILNNNSGAAFYRVSLEIEPEELSKLGDKQLLPGMPIEVFIQTNERSALNYLLKPIIDNFNRALTEE